ncbi:hypothetical protein [Prosthecobacter sp.]|uniref:hypothetical protein n=1 Tax=Prosthecobacter sp. TaxID=1965333 RepID=UPI003784A2B7
MSLSRTPRGFTILESLVMLGLLTVFSIAAVAILKKGITSSKEAQDPAWLEKGGDESMVTISPPGLKAPDPALPPKFPATREKAGAELYKTQPDR